MQQTFARCDTPDNRRTVDFHIRINAPDEVHGGNALENNHDTAQQAEAHYFEAHFPHPEEKTFDDYLKDLDFERYLDDPEYFIKVVMETDAQEKRRINVKTKPWQTRFMNLGNNTRNRLPPSLPLVDAVRTHLK